MIAVSHPKYDPSDYEVRQLIVDAIDFLNKSKGLKIIPKLNSFYFSHKPGKMSWFNFNYVVPDEKYSAGNAFLFDVFDYKRYLPKLLFDYACGADGVESPRQKALLRIAFDIYVDVKFKLSDIRGDDTRWEIKQQKIKEFVDKRLSKSIERVRNNVQWVY